MAKRTYVVKARYLALKSHNVYQGSEVELDPSSDGVKKLLELGAIEAVKVSKPPIVEETEHAPND